MQNDTAITICTPQTPPKQRRVNATELLKEIQIMLICESSRLIDLPQEIVFIDNNSGDVTFAHLKCSIAITAGTRAHKHYDQTGKSYLDDEDHIKRRP